MSAVSVCVFNGCGWDCAPHFPAAEGQNAERPATPGALFDHPTAILSFLCQHDYLIAFGEGHRFGFLRVGKHAVGWRLAGFTRQPVADSRLAATAGGLDQGVEINSEIVPINLTGSRVSFYT